VNEALSIPMPPWAEALMARIERIDTRPRSIDDYGADDVIPTDEMAAVLRLSVRAARDWAVRWGVRPCAENRWPVHRIRLGLRREATTGGRRARRPGKAPQKSEVVEVRA
jgi:hypothetical protein